MTSGIKIINSKAFVDQVSIEKIIKLHDTPVLIFSEKRIVDNYNIFCRAFKKYYPNTEVYYSVKTNFEVKILKTLQKLGSKGEVASALEVLIAEKAGFKSNQLILDGPAWKNEDIRVCIKKGIRTFNADSLDELKRVNEEAKKLHKKVRVSLRIYPEIKISILKSFIEGYIGKFGIPIHNAIEAYKEAQTMSNIEPVAISTHIGSMITNPGYYEKTVDKLVNLAAELKSKLGITIEEINLGGGYGIQSLNYFSLQNVILEKAGIAKYTKAPHIEEFGKRIANRFKNQSERHRLSNLKLILEPGRFIVSDAGVLITKVVAVKDKWIFIDGGVNLIPESIFFIRRGFMVANKLNHVVNKQYNIAGPTLSTADVLADRQTMPVMNVGDTVIVLDAGAYSLPRSTQFTMLRPKVLYVTSDGSIKLLRKKEETKDLIEKLIP